MLRELRIRNYAVIDDLRLELGAGLNVLTGETGAGKSIIVGALSLLLGERASTDVVRAGEEKAQVEGVFDIAKAPTLKRVCQEQGIDIEDGWLILRREVQRKGRNRAWVNGSSATAALIGRLGSDLVDLHGQHEHQALLHREAQRRILDRFAGASDLADRTAGAHARWHEVESRIERAHRRAASTRERAEDLAFRVREIEAAHLEPDEEERTRGELRRLKHSEELLELTASMHGAVYGDDGCLVDGLGAVAKPLDDLVRIDPDTAELRSLYDEARAALAELGRRLAGYHHAVEHDPGRLEELRERLDLVYRLKRKYGDTLEEVLETGAAARAELDALDRSALDLEVLEQEAGEARKVLRAAAEALSEKRGAASRALEESVSDLLRDLGMEGGRFVVALEPVPETGPAGSERVEFRVSLNPGFDPGPLSRIASGGELSRVMLALKTVLAEVDAVPCLVFDEIDSGVGGRVAHQVARRLADVAARHQVFAVTHLPQIASRADTHLQVDKIEKDGRAAARVRRLSAEERVGELARMLGGDPSSATSRRHAAELLSERMERQPG